MSGAERLGAYRDRPVIVTGATGFIGRAVARSLALAGARVHLAVRDELAGRELAESLEARRTDAENSDRRKTHAAIKVHGWSATDADQSERLVRELAPVVVFNLAGYGVDPTERDPELARAINAELPVTLGRALAETAVDGWTGARLAHVGSALEYGLAGGDLDENTPAHPTTLYGKTKLAGTLGIEALDLPAFTARLFTVYGPGEPAGRLLPALIALSSSGDRLPVTAGEQLRDFTYVQDVADGLLRLATADTAPRVVNLATGVLTPVRAFIHAAVDVLGLSSDAVGWGELPTRPEEMSHDPVSVRRLEAAIGWRPETSIPAGIARTAGLDDPLE